MLRHLNVVPHTAREGPRRDFPASTAHSVFPLHSLGMRAGAVWKTRCINIRQRSVWGLRTLRSSYFRKTRIQSSLHFSRLNKMSLGSLFKVFLNSLYSCHSSQGCVDEVFNSINRAELKRDTNLFNRLNFFSNSLERCMILFRASSWHDADQS